MQSNTEDLPAVCEFTQTSDEPYIRHVYQLVLLDQSTLLFDDYIELRDYWMQRRGQNCSHIIVLDKPKPKKKGGGFK